MAHVNRRNFLAGSLSTTALTAVSVTEGMSVFGEPIQSPHVSETPIDFRYAPSTFQTAICLPDDHWKTIVGEHGDLRYDFPDDRLAAVNQFGTIVEFTLAGMNRDVVKRQWIESPTVPIVHTLIARQKAEFELIAFATDRPVEGRVDNVILRVRAKKTPINAVPLIKIRSCKSYRLGKKNSLATEVYLDGRKNAWMTAIPQNSQSDLVTWRNDEGGYLLNLEHCSVLPGESAEYLFRFPQGQSGGNLDLGASPQVLLDGARAWWAAWKPFGKTTEISLSGVHEDFLLACARNIQQARENVDGRLVFQVGPTVYRGLWIVDGNFLLEAGRYLGYDKEADEGLLSEWKRQQPDGRIVAGGGGEHWKDTAIAMFTLVRTCELKQDWSDLRNLAPEVRRAIEFLTSLRDNAKAGTSTNGRYGLLAPGFADGGMDGVRSEFSNTVWALAGLKSIAKANEKLAIPALDKASEFYRELRSAFDVAARKEMVNDPRGFRYLPILMGDEPILHAKERWNRPQPQVAQWALSHAIFPGEVFAKDDPIVRGHVALMQASTKEDIPAETGWLWHDAVWNYNAAFVAEIYLWLGLRDWARTTFNGFLNHASPLYAWREEQPLQDALFGDNWGDMPHNWASAECVRYLRHMYVLEDGTALRLLAGITAQDLQSRHSVRFRSTPTRFGRISMSLEPSARRGWHLQFEREGVNPSASLELPSRLYPGGSSVVVEGANVRAIGPGLVAIDPTAGRWTATWQT